MFVGYFGKMAIFLWVFGDILVVVWWQFYAKNKERNG